MAVKRISRFGLTVRQIEMMAKFYQDAFGCQIIGDTQGDAAARAVHDARLRCISLSLGQQVIELAGFAPPGAAWPEER